ncbi:MAG: hypothetical protein OQL19_13555 [Gammaproteobacteria bacterium]|nr:hypothetical protein [Gammaproteobacteria bacterium]
MKKSLLIIIIFFATFIFFSQIDDELSEEAQNLIEKVEQTNDTNVSEAYLYLIGIYANSNDDPIEIGRKQLGEYRKLEEDEKYQLIEYPESEKLLLPKGELFCSTSEDDCLATLFSKEFDIHELRKKHETLISRVNQFHKYSEYKTLTKPIVVEQFPPYQYLSKIERLNVLTAISLYKEGNIEEAVSLLLNKMKQLRKMMALQDNLIGKVVYLMKLSEAIDVVSIILSESGRQIKTDLIPNLSLTEKNFDLVSAREFAMSYYLFKNLDKHPEFFEIEGNLPGWITRIVFKPNMTINGMAPIFTRLDRLSKMTPKEFAAEMTEERNFTVSTSKFRNYVGNILIGISPTYDEYVGRFKDFDLKIHLFNQIYHYGVDDTAVANPYFERESSYLSESSICFKGVLEDDSQIRCLKTKK